MTLPRRIKAVLGTFDRSLPSITSLKYRLEHEENDDVQCTYEAKSILKFNLMATRGEEKIRYYPVISNLFARASIENKIS